MAVGRLQAATLESPRREAAAQERDASLFGRQLHVESLTLNAVNILLPRSLLQLVTILDIIVTTKR